MESQTYRHWLKLSWGMAKYPILFMLFCWLLFQAEPGIKQVLQTKPDYTFLFYAAIIYQIGIFFIAWRFQIMLACLKIRRTYILCLTSYLESVPYFFISPGGIGMEFSRYLKLKSDQSAMQERDPIIFSLLADRVIGFLAAIAVAGMGLTSIAEIAQNHSFSLPGSPYLYVGVVLAAGFLMYLLKGKIALVLSKLRGIFDLYAGNNSQIFLICLLGLLSQISLGSTTYLVARAAYIDISWFDTVWITAAGMLLLVIPAAAFGFTLMDVSVVFLYNFSGLSLSDAAFLALVGYLMRLWLGMQGVLLDFAQSIRKKFTGYTTK